MDYDMEETVEIGLDYSTLGLEVDSIPTNQSSAILQHSQNRSTGDRWLKF